MLYIKIGWTTEIFPPGSLQTVPSNITMRWGLILLKSSATRFVGSEAIAYEISRRSHKNLAQKKKQNAALEPSSELTWKLKVAACTSQSPQLLSAEKINFYLVALTRY